MSHEENFFADVGSDSYADGDGKREVNSDARRKYAVRAMYALYGVIERDNPNLMRLLEIYESDEAYRIHSISEAFKQYRAERLPFLAGLKLLPVNEIVLKQKARGVGTVVKTYRFEVAPVDLAKFQQIISDEAVRAVREDSAAQKYFTSDAYKNYRRQVAAMIQTEHTIDYQPTRIQLSEKF